jgi:hypothetical protein
MAENTPAGQAKLWCYPSAGKKKAFRMCKVFANGSGGQVAPPGQPYLHKGAAFFYGWTDHTIPLIRQCQAQGTDWYYADNAYYFGRGKFFRVTKNRFMHDGVGNAGPERFEKFGIKVKPWRKDGRHILITTQSELFYEARLGTTREAWTNELIEELRKHTDREIIVCHKPPVKTMASNQPHAIDLESQIRDAWALVTHSSSSAVKAVLEGVPVFSLAPSMVSCMGLDDLGRIEEPVYPDDREPWLWNLAANQWTFREMRDGACWRDLGHETPLEMPILDARIVVETFDGPPDRVVS